MAIHKSKKSEKPRGGAREGAGRKPVDEPLKTKSIRVSDADWQRWKDKAKASGKTLNEWLRDVCNKAAK